MSRIIETTVYQFDELNPEAKERARDWYREASSADFAEFHAESMYEDFLRVAEIFGITIRTYRKTYGIYWSGFSSQGDGASYAGHYRYAKGTPKKIREYAPQDTELHRIADDLQHLQRLCFYTLTASINAGNSHYSHSGTMRFEVENRLGGEVAEGYQENLTQLLRDFADWMYRQLEKEYEYQNSDEVVDENIRANEYEFTENGARF
jgi:hypothetical protein